MRVIALLLGGVGQERAHARQLARRRRGAEPLPSPVGQECPKVRRAEAEQPCRLDLLATVAAEKLDQPVRRSDIGAHRVRRAAAIMLEIICPLRSKRLGRVN